MADGIELRILSDKLPQILEQLPELASQIVEKTGHDVQAQAQQNAPVDLAYLRSSIQFEMTGPAEGMITVGANYGAAVEWGSVAHFPPVDALEAWAERHGMPGAGYAIARKISQRGTPAHPYLTPAVEANRQPFADAWKQIEELAK